MMDAVISFPDIGPALVTFEAFGRSFALRWYALAYIVGLLIAAQIVRMVMRRPLLWPDNQAPMPAERVDDLLTYMILGVILGGRLGYVLFYKSAYYLDNPLEILAVWNGGMSFHGGFLGVVVGALLFCRRGGYRVLSVGDAVALSTPPGLLLGRVSNFINGELWGRPSDLPWAVTFPGEAASRCALWGGAPCARHPSQLYEGALEGLVLGLVMLWGVRRGWLKRPAHMIGVFLAGYGAARFTVEFFRQPDAFFQGPGNPLGLALHMGGVGLTMGQILSLPMIALGLWLVARRI